MLISHSQILSFQKCERRFWWEHIEKIKPKDYPPALKKGISGHYLFEVAFKAVQEGKTYEEVVQALNPVIADPNILENGGMEIYRHVLAYLAYFYTMPWKVIHVEESYVVPTDADADFAFTPDLILEWTSGPKRGQKFMIDFKFTGQYWNENELGVYQQLPKYIRYYHKLTGEVIWNATVAMLNTRAARGATGTGLFLHKPLKITREKLNRIEYENEVLMRRVKTAKDTWSEGDFMRTVDSYQCKRCFFAALCAMDLNGQDTTKYKERNFEPNTYFDDNYALEPSELT